MPEASVTLLLARARAGEPGAVDRLVPLVYDELRALARAQLRREDAGHTLSATALVHEAYLRMVRGEVVEASDRHHFFAIAARTMRRVLIDHARTRKRIKRGSGAAAVGLDEAAIALPGDLADELVALDEALRRLEAASPRAARVVECRFFAGLTLEETADALQVSPKTVQRDWLTARAWLRADIAGAR